jgi:hypothetical protein
LTFPPDTHSEVTLVWETSEVRCVIARYDETRYQLRLLRGLGTVKTDLFADYVQALTASREWRATLTHLSRCNPQK